MAMNVGTGGALNSDINVTPLVDVVLVLLIIFMVVTPLTQRGYDIDIPRDSSNLAPDPKDLEKQVILAVSESDCGIALPIGPTGLPPACSVRINKESVKVSELALKMNDIFKTRKGQDKILFLAAQEKLNYEGIVQILDIARSGAGEDLKIGIVTDEKLAMAPSTN